MQAVILAAGMGSRLKNLTSDQAKCMVTVNGSTLIERMLYQLDELGLSRIVLVVGYEAQKLIKYVNSLGIQTPVAYVENTIYAKTNNIYSLALTEEYLKGDDTLLLESDLIFEKDLLRNLVDDKRSTLAVVDMYQPWMEGTCFALGENDSVCEMISSKKRPIASMKGYYKTVNIYKFSNKFLKESYVPLLDAYMSKHGKNDYYEQVLCELLGQEQCELRAKRLDGELWYEIDDVQDLIVAEKLFEMV